MIKNYTNKEAIEDYMLQEIDVTFDTRLDAIMEGVERIIDNITGRNFKADTTDSARVFDGDGTPELLIDDAISISKVEVADDEYASSFTEVGSTGSDRYYLEPNNYSALGYPISKITLSARDFTCGKQTNRITGKWGYSADVPKDIEFAATVFVAGILNQNRQGGDQIKTEKIGNYQVTYNSENGEDSFADFKQAMAILESYKKLII